jgi:hypothetical protein
MTIAEDILGRVPEVDLSQRVQTYHFGASSAPGSALT